MAGRQSGPSSNQSRGEISRRSERFSPQRRGPPGTALPDFGIDDGEGSLGGPDKGFSSRKSWGKQKKGKEGFSKTAPWQKYNRGRYGDSPDSPVHKAKGLPNTLQPPKPSVPKVIAVPADVSIAKFAKLIGKGV